MWTEIDGLVREEAADQEILGGSAEVYTEKIGNADWAKEMVEWKLVMRDFTESNWLLAS